MNTKKKFSERFIAFFLSFIMIFTLIPTEIFAADDSETVSINFNQQPIIDIVLAKGRTNITNLNTDSFDTDLKNALKGMDVDVDKILKIQRVETSSVDMSSAFNWQKDFMDVDTATSWSGSSSNGIGRIDITNNGANVVMYGNDHLAGKNAIYTIPTKDSQQKFTYDYNIQFGDSFNAAGMILRVSKSGNRLSGYMLSFNNRGNFKSLSNANGAIWKFEFDKGTNRTNFTSTTSGSKITLVQPLNISTSGKLTITTDNKYISVSGGGLTNEVSVAIDDNTGPGFGFFSDHYRHSCSSIGNFTLTGISLEETNVQHFTDVLKQPNWNQDSIRVIVNINDYVEEDFASPDAVADILARCLNEHINYVSWGPTSTKEQNEQFIKQNSNNGKHIDISGQSSYQNAINTTAAYIKSLLPDNESQGNEYVIADKYIDMQITPERLKYDTATTDYPYGRWMLQHEPEVFDNSNGTYVDTGLYRNSMDIEYLSKVGKYDVYFEDDIIKTVYVHRMPVAAFTMVVSGTSVTLNNISYDLDRQSNTSSGIGRGGIQAERWSYKEATATSWIQLPAGQKTFNITSGKNYIVQLEVQDYQGQWSDPATKYIQGTSSASTPVADFVFNKNQISKYATDLTLTNMSYDPKGLAIDRYRWNVVKDGTTNIITNSESSSFTTPNINFQSYGKGSYAFTLEVRNSQGTWSDSYTRYLTVIEDTDAPEITVNPSSGEWSSSTSQHVITATLTDEDSKLKQFRYAITTTQTAPTQSSGSWTGTTSLGSVATATKQVVVNQQGIYYVHIEAIDNANNRAVITRGPYKIDNVKPTVSFVSIKNLGEKVPSTQPLISLMSLSPINHVGDEKVEITLTASDATSGINRVVYQLNTSSNWVQASRSGSTNNYVFRINESYDGDINVLAYDNAGNVSEQLVLQDILLVNSTPQITITNNSDWQTGNPVRFPVQIITDSRLNIASATFNTTEDVPTSKNLTSLGGNNYAVDLYNEGVYFFEVTATNNAGTTGYATSEVVRIDRTPPIIEDYEVVLTSVLPSVNPFSLQNDIITNRGLKIDFDISDNLSGFDHLEYELPGDALPRIVPAGQTYFTVDEAINGNILVRAYDVAGNVSLTTTISNIIVDNVKPSIDIGNIPTWSNENITIDVDVSDETLLDKVAWFTTESPDTPTAQGMTYSPATLFPGTVTLSNEGIYTLVVSAYDKAGNISKVESETIRIDKTPPEIIDLEFYMPQTEILNDEELKEENTTPSQNPPLDTPPENEIDNENDSVDSNPPIITDDSQQEEGENSTPAPPVNNNNDNDEQVEDTEEDTKEDAETTEDTNENLVNESDDNVSFVLTIKHVTEDGTPIANKGAVIVKILDANSEYTSSPINIKGYTFKEMDEESAPVNGIMDSNKTIIYVYTLETVESDENENIEDEITQISQAAIPLSFVEDNIFGSNILVQIFPRDILGYANSGVDKVWYKIESDDGLTTTDWTIVSPDSKGYYFFTINKDFTGTVFARCSDIAGNMSDEYSEHIILDMTSPDPTLILNVNSTDWGLVPGEVDIQAADVNGLDSVYVEIETIEGDTIHEPFELVTMDGQKILNESFTIHEDGVYEITVTAQDIAGNSATKTKTIHIDRTAPEIHDVVFSIVDDDNQVIEYDANVTNKKLLVEVDLSDNMSGFDYMEYQTMDSPTWNRVAQGIDEFYVATAYKGNIKVRIYDKAGNVSTVFVSDEITVETDDPTLIVSKDEAWTPTGVTLHVDANDPMSGIKNVVYSYTAADGVPVTGQCDMIGDKVNTDVFFDKHGSYTITFTATDNAGNTSSVTRRVNIDRTTQFPAPDIDSHGYISGTWSDKAINVTLGYNDQSVVPISGIKKYQYKDIDTDQWIDGVPELDGYLDNSYVFRAISTVGCISDETIVFSAKIDKVAPVIVGEDVGGESSNEPLKIVVSVIEEESGIKIVEASFDGNTWFEIHANSDGNYVVDLGNEYIGDVYIKATDICGNVSDTYVVNDLVIDFERPRLVLSENSDVKDVIILKATENIKKGREGYVRIYDTKELDYIAPIAELHISNNRIKVEGEYVYINMVGLVDGQRQYAVEVDEGFVWDLANNLCYPMELSYLGTSDTKVPSLQNVIVTNPSNNESYPAVFDETKNEYNVIIPTDIVGQIIITPIFDMEIPELWATSNDIQIDYVGREDIGITIDDDYAWPVSIDIKALSKTTTVNIYRGNIEVDINTDEDIRIDEMDVLRAVDIVPFLEDGVVYTLVVNAEENYPNESDETKAYNFISTTDNFVDLSSGFNIEIWLYETKNGKTDEGRIINELQNGLEITLTIPDDMMDRDAYGIVRVHNGKAEMLRSTVNYNKITFNSDKFSSYYIAVGETVQVEVPETIIRDWGDGVPNDTYCIVPSLIGNDGIISRFSYVDENDVMNFIKPIAGNYHLTQNHKVFPDVTWNTYQWAYESIHALAARGLVAGFDDGRFGPGETITRAQLVTILARLENLPMDYTKSSFTDVDENDWFFQYVEAAYDAGLIAGIGNKQFAPNRYITRQELSTILYRYMEYKGKNPDITMNKVFTDQTSISYWASNAVNAVANAGIIAGYDNGAFGPMNNATRAEASTMIWRFIRYIVDNSKDVYELTSYSEVIDE